MASAQSAAGDPETSQGLSARAATLLARIDHDLPSLARELILQSPSVSARFLERPDDPDEHKPEWHQYGIITHTRQFVVALRSEVPGALRRIDPMIAARAAAYFAEPLDGLTRWELLLVAGYWHDAGKFTTRTVGRRGDWRFVGHAHDSARLIVSGTGGGLGVRYGLTAAQTAFVARLADLHYAPMELKLALDRSGGVPPGRDVYAEIAANLGAEGYAICALFWADCLSKGDTLRQRAQRPELWELLVRTLHAVDVASRPAAQAITED